MCVLDERALRILDWSQVGHIFFDGRDPERSIILLGHLQRG